jgi:hypothetical protein
MDYQYLADLLFPDLKLTIEEVDETGRMIAERFSNYMSKIVERI